jgi:hypothetical protein
MRVKLVKCILGKIAMGSALRAICCRQRYFIRHFAAAKWQFAAAKRGFSEQPMLRQKKGA